jgi:hypothetical protein
MSGLNIHKMIPCQFLEFLEKFLVLLSLFYNKVTNISTTRNYLIFDITIMSRIK